MSSWYPDLVGTMEVVADDEMFGVEIVGSPVAKPSMVSITVKTSDKPHAAVAFTCLKAIPGTESPFPLQATTDDNLAVAGAITFWAPAGSSETVTLVGKVPGLVAGDQVWFSAASTPDMADITAHPEFIPSTGPTAPPILFARGRGR